MFGNGICTTISAGCSNEGEQLDAQDSVTFSPAYSDISQVWDAEQIFVKLFQTEIEADMQNIAHILQRWCTCSTGQGRKENSCFMAWVAIATNIKICHEVSASLKLFNTVELNGIVCAAPYLVEEVPWTTNSLNDFRREPEFLQAL